MQQKKKINPNTHKTDQHKNNKAWNLKDHDKELGYRDRAVLDKLCDHCYGCITWKLNYGKYKPLGVPGKCCKCLMKCIFKSYRTICDKCAKEKKVCTKCGTDTKKYANMPDEMIAKIKDDSVNFEAYLKKLREGSRRKIARLKELELIYWDEDKHLYFYKEDDAPVEGLKLLKKHRDEADGSDDDDLDDDMEEEGQDVVDQELKSRKRLKSENDDLYSKIINKTLV